MPVKWKIFLVLNFVLSLPALIGFILLLTSFLRRRYLQTDEEYLIIFLPLFCLLMISLNGLLNIYLLQRFFPDRLLPPGVKRFNIILLVLNVLVSIGILILIIYAASYEFGNDFDGSDNSGKIALTLILSLWLVQVVVLVMQGQLPGLISRKNREKMDSLIDSIGQ